MQTPIKGKKINVLFLCSENSCRSQMAEAFLRELAGDKFEPYSAGLESSSVNPIAVKVMSEKGIDISSQVSKSVDKFLGKESFMYVIFVCEGAEKECPVIYPVVPNALSWPLQDPAAFRGSEEQKLEVFRNTRDEIERLVKEFIAKLTRE